MAEKKGDCLFLLKHYSLLAYPLQYSGIVTKVQE